MSMGFEKGSQSKFGDILWNDIITFIVKVKKCNQYNLIE